MWTPLVMVRGDTRTFALSLTENGLPLDLSTATEVSFSIAGRVTKTTADGVTLDADPTTGDITVTLGAADTSGLPAERTVRAYDVEVVLADGSIKTPLRGSLVVLPDVT